MSALATHDPAVAGAMARCLTARSLDPTHRLTRHHERPCGWCDWPTDELRAGLDAFNAWAAPRGRDDVSGQHLVRVFGELPRAEQERQILAAQAFPELPPSRPAEQPAPEPVTVGSAVDAPEEENAWR